MQINHNFSCDFIPFCALSSHFHPPRWHAFAILMTRRCHTYDELHTCLYATKDKRHNTLPPSIRAEIPDYLLFSVFQG